MITLLWVAFPYKLLAQNDFILVETLIKGHKRISDKLRDRIIVDGTATVSSTLVESNTKSYSEVTDTLSSRMGHFTMTATLAADVALLLLRVNAVIETGEKAYSKAGDVMIDHPEVLDMAMTVTQSGIRYIAEIYNIIAYVSTGGIRSSLATSRQRKMMVENIKNRLIELHKTYSNFYIYCSYLDLMGNDDGEWVRPDLQQVYNRSLERINSMVNYYQLPTP